MKIIYPLLLVLSSCTSTAQPAKELDANLFEKAILDSSIQLLDVRTAVEYKSGHLKNSLQANWNNQVEFLERIPHLDKNKPLYIYCLSGGRSAAAGEFLRKNGFVSVVVLKGGIASWKVQGKTIEGGSGIKQMTMEEYHSSVISNKTVLVDFGAEWCPPCKKMEPVLKELQRQYGSMFSLVKVDGGNDTEIMKANNVEALPVFIIYKSGKETWRKQGIVSLEELKKNL